MIEKAGIRLASLPDVPITLFKLVIRSPLPVASLVLQSITSATDTVTSTLQSHRRGGLTEIDYLNGEIVRLGSKMNLATPYNSKVVELIREIEKTHQFYSLSQVESFFSPKQGQETGRPPK